MPELSHVLYIEDEPDIREITIMALEMLGGLKVTVAKNGEEALQALPHFSGELILSDHTLPDLSGPELCSSICEQDALKRPIVMLTGHTFTPTERQALTGVIGVVNKPYDPETLFDKLQELVSQGTTP